MTLRAKLSQNGNNVNQRNFSYRSCTLEFLTNYGLFLAKTLTFLFAVFIVVSLVASASGRNKRPEKGHIQVNKLNDKFDSMRETLQTSVLDEIEYKLHEKNEKKRLKAEKAENKKLAKEKSKTKADEVESLDDKRRVFVLDFHGDIKASACD